MSLYNIVNMASLQPGQPEDVSQVLANFQAIQAVLNGGIDDNNVRSTAAIQPSKLAAYPANALMSLRGDGSWQRTPPTRQIFTSGSGTYTTPAGCKAILVECVAGGGGGGGANVTTSGQQSVGGGGGGGSYSASLIQSPAATYAYAVGAGGAGGVGVASGTTGSDTTFGGTIVVAKAGLGGASIPQQAIDGAATGGGPGPAGSATGDLRVDGGGGQCGLVFGGVTTVVCGSGGGGAVYGAIRNGVASLASNGSNGLQYGGGGSGAGRGSSTSSQTGGTGGTGLIIVTEFY